MTDDNATPVSRDEFEALVRRVERLEEQVDENPSAVPTGGLDHRDKAVLSVLREHGDVGPRKTLKLYLRETDITQHDTAKQRAKNLRKSDAFEEAVA